MKRAYQIFLTFLKIFMRDRANIIFIFFFNAFLMIIFGLTMEDKYNLSIELGVVETEQTAASTNLIDHLGEQPNLVINKFPSKEVLMKELQNGKLVAGVLFNQSKNTQTTDESQMDISILGDPSRKMWLKFIEPGLRIASIESNVKYQSAIEAVQIETSYVKSKNLKYFDFIFPGLLIFSIMQIGLAGGLTLLTQRKNQSLKRLKITPLKKWEFLLGYGGSYLCIMILQNIFYIFLAITIFDYSFSGSLPAIISVILLSALLFIGLGIMLSNYVSSVESGNNIITLLTFPAAFLCGIFMPMDSMPSYVQHISNIHPLTHLASIMRGIANYNASINDFANLFGFLIVLFLLITVYSLKSFKWQEKLA